MDIDALGAGLFLVALAASILAAVVIYLPLSPWLTVPLGVTLALGVVGALGS